MRAMCFSGKKSKKFSQLRVNGHIPMQALFLLIITSFSSAAVSSKPHIDRILKIVNNQGYATFLYYTPFIVPSPLDVASQYLIFQLDCKQ